MRRKHSAEFKKKVAIEALREQKTISQIASEHQIHPMLVTKWRRQILEGCHRFFSDTVPDNKEVDVSVLERKIGQLTIENDFLKKNSNDSSR